MGAAMLTAEKKAATPRRMASPANPQNTGADVAWKARMTAANAAKKKDPERTAALLFHSVSFHARSLVEAAPGVHPARAQPLPGENAGLCDGMSETAANFCRRGCEPQSQAGNTSPFAGSEQNRKLTDTLTVDTKSAR